MRTLRAAAAALLVALGMGLAALPWVEGGSPGSAAPRLVDAATQTDSAGQVLELLNAYRAQGGLQPVTRSARLSAAAQWFAEDMARNGYRPDHSDSTGRTFGQRMVAFGYGGQAAGENIAAGYPSAAAVMEGWKASPPHNANLHGAAFRAAGIGYAAGGQWGHVWVMDLGAQPDASAPPPTPTPTPARPPLAVPVYRCGQACVQVGEVLVPDEPGTFAVVGILRDGDLVSGWHWAEGGR